MRITIHFLTALLTVVFLASLVEIYYNVDSANASSEKTDDPSDIVITTLYNHPEAGNTIYCDDGSLYEITDTSQYSQQSAETLPLEFLAEALSSERPKLDAIHFSDISGDYLFVKNLYEEYRMLYTLCQTKDGTELRTQFCIPEDAVPTVSENWGPEQITALNTQDLSRTYCLECWDIYENGSYQKTVYMTAVI